MGWKELDSGLDKWQPKVDIIYDGLSPIDARIYFGQYCHDKKRGVLLSEIADMPKGKQYLRWISTDFDKATDELIQAADEVLR
jgi:hypothetical protein